MNPSCLKKVSPLNDRFFKVPNAVFELNLKSSELIVLMYMLRCADIKTRRCFPSYTDITEKCRVSRETAIKSVKALERAGLIVKVAKGYSGEFGVKRANTYEVL